MLLTFRQAALLAMVTFTKAINYCYNKLNSAKLMSPLCGAIFSRDSLGEMARELNMEEIKVLEIINESSTSGGQYLPSSDIACAIYKTGYSHDCLRGNLPDVQPPAPTFLWRSLSSRVPLWAPLPAAGMSSIYRCHCNSTGGEQNGPVVDCLNSDTVDWRNGKKYCTHMTKESAHLKVFNTRKTGAVI
ncbi:hypothetical protein ACJJTC_012454 [Scirpophaga incertulas]